MLPFCRHPVSVFVMPGSFVAVSAPAVTANEHITARPHIIFQ